MIEDEINSFEDNYEPYLVIHTKEQKILDKEPDKLDLTSMKEEIITPRELFLGGIKVFKDGESK